MATTYAVEPKRIEDGMVVTPENPQDAEFYGVYTRGINEHWGIGGKGEDSPHLWNYLRDYPTQESAQAFVRYLQSNTPQLQLLEHAEPVKVLGVRYVPSADRDVNGKSSHYIPELALSDRSSEYRAVMTWELYRYFRTGEASPDLAANALTESNRFSVLNSYEQQSLKDFAQSAQVDPFFRTFRETETKYMRDAGAQIPEGVNFRISILDDMPESLQRFVQDESRHPAIKHLEAIANHPAIAQFQQMQNLPHMPERAKALYGDTLLRNYPDLSLLYEQAKNEIQKLDRTDPALMEKVSQTARNLPDLEAGVSGNLASALQSLALPTQTVRKP